VWRRPPALPREPAAGVLLSANMAEALLSHLGASWTLEYVQRSTEGDHDMDQISQPHDWKNLRLSVHRLSDGGLATSLIVRRWTGGVAWDKRLSPLQPLSMETGRPEHVDPRLWALHHAVSRLMERQSGWIC
jgi:hypothetical protein